MDLLQQTVHEIWWPSQDNFSILSDPLPQRSHSPRRNPLVFGLVLVGQFPLGMDVTTEKGALFF